MYAPSSYNETVVGETLSSISEKSRESYTQEDSVGEYEVSPNLLRCSSLCLVFFCWFCDFGVVWTHFDVVIFFYLYSARVYEVFNSLRCFFFFGFIGNYFPFKVIASRKRLVVWFNWTTIDVGRSRVWKCLSWRVDWCCNESVIGLFIFSYWYPHTCYFHTLNINKKYIYK